MRKRVYLPIVILTIMGLLTLINRNSLKSLVNQRFPDTFSLDKIALDITEDFPTFEMPNLSSMIQGPFYYLGAGGQAVAFESEDHEYVLKFFLTKALHGNKKYPLPKPTHWISSHKQKRQIQRKERKLRHLLFAMHSYAKALPILKEKTGILALQLRAQKGDLPIVLLYDKEKNKHLVDLNRASFVLQKKAITVSQKFQESLSKEKKLELLRSLQNFFAERTLLGLIDLDKNILLGENYGFLGDLPIQFDVGKIVFNEQFKREPQEEIRRMQSIVRNWALERNLPTQGLQ